MAAIVLPKQYHSLQSSSSVVLPTPEELFEVQVFTLRDKGLSLPSNEAKRLHLLIPNEPQLFLVVPAQPGQLDLDGLMALIKVKGKTGRNYLDRKRLTDVVDTPKTAHLFLSVEDGRKEWNTHPYVHPDISAENLQAEGRLPYTTWHGIIHAILFPYVLQSFSLNLMGSRYETDDVPTLCLDNGTPGLYSFWRNCGRKWGAPSAGSIAGADA